MDGRESRVPGESGFMDIEGWRKKIDDLDQKLVALLSERARAAVEIGKLKRNTSHRPAGIDLNNRFEAKLSIA